MGSSLRPRKARVFETNHEWLRLGRRNALGLPRASAVVIRREYYSLDKNARPGPRKQKLLSFCLIGSAWFFAAAAPPASAQFKAWVIAKLPDTPEGMAVDSNSNIYTTLLHAGEVIMLKDDGSYDHVAWVPSKEESGKGDLIGLDFDRADNIYVAYRAHSKYDATDLANPFHPSCRDATVTRSGVYKIDAKTRKVTALATKADGWPFCFPDDVAIDSQGNVYLTDLTYSGIWKISPEGKKVDLWSAHPLLNWSPRPYSGAPLGVNDLALDKQEKNIYAVTDGDPMVLRIPIKEDGSAVNPRRSVPPGTRHSMESHWTRRATSTSPRSCETRSGCCLPTVRNAY